MPAGAIGRRRSLDARNALYRYRAAAVPTTSVRWVRHAPVFDQQAIGSCTGNAVVGALATGPLCDALTAARVVVPFTEDTAVAIYGDATRLDGYPGQYPPTDSGSDGPSAAKAARNRGWLSGYQHAATPADALAALAHGPVITGVDWYEGFDDPDRTGRMSLTGRPRGGHEIVVDTIDVNNRRVWITNSWGTGWGQEGRAWWSWDDWTTLLTTGGDATILTPITAPAPQPATDDVDRALWDATKVWAYARHAGANKRAAADVRGWASAKHLT